MANPNKWREFWLWTNVQGTTIASEYEPAGQDTIHVIEALPALAEIDRLKRKVSLIHNTDMRNREIHAQALSEIEQLKAEKIEVARSAAVLIDDVKAKLAEARKIIEFYGDLQNWSGGRHLTKISDKDWDVRSNYNSDEEYIGGKRAREYLKANGEG